MELIKKESVKARGSMDSLVVEQLITRSEGSLYRLVRLAMVRALELADGKPSLIKNPLSEKTATIALQEISQGKVVMKPSGKLKKENLSEKEKEASKGAAAVASL